MGSGEGIAPAWSFPWPFRSFYRDYDIYSGHIRDKRFAEVTPYPFGLSRDLGFLACTLPHVDILMPMKKPRDQELTLEQQLANQALYHWRQR